jgi:hypothetical protein
VDGSGNIYVSDQYNYVVKKFNSSFVYQGQIGVTGVTGNGNYQFSTNGPGQLTVDSSGNIYVCDLGNYRVQVYNSSLTYVGTIGGTYGTGNNQFEVIIAVGVDSSGNVYCLDSAYNTMVVKKFNSSRTWVATYGGPGSGNTQLNYPVDLKIDSSNNLWIVDGGNNRVLVWNSSGTYVTTHNPIAVPQPLSVWSYQCSASTKVMSAFVNQQANGTPVTSTGYYEYGAMLTLMGDPAGNGGFVGSIPECYAYVGALSNSDRLVIENNIKSYYGTP